MLRGRFPTNWSNTGHCHTHTQAWETDGGRSHSNTPTPTPPYTNLGPALGLAAAAGSILPDLCAPCDQPPPAHVTGLVTSHAPAHVTGQNSPSPRRRKQVSSSSPPPPPAPAAGPSARPGAGPSSPGETGSDRGASESPQQTSSWVPANSVAATSDGRRGPGLGPGPGPTVAVSPLSILSLIRSEPGPAGSRSPGPAGGPRSPLHAVRRGQ